MKMVIIKDNMYPVFFLEYDYLDYPKVDVPQDKLDWITSTSKEFEKTQEYLSELYNKEE
jgi:hypothetical protein